MSLPERFDLNYIDSDNEKHRPIMIHRTVMGSIERFLGILIEHFAGKFPLWMAPVQVVGLPINDQLIPYAHEVMGTMEQAGLRTEVDSRTESLNKKIREAVTHKIPNIVIIGGKEVENRSITLRRYCVKEQIPLSFDSFVERLNRLRAERTMDNFPDVRVE